MSLRRNLRAGRQRQDRSQALSSPGGYPHIKDQEQEHPDDVDEVPVEGNRGRTDMIPGGELAAGGAVQDQDQQDQSAQHVGAMEAGHREERAGEGVGGEVQAATEGVDELV